MRTTTDAAGIFIFALQSYYFFKIITNKNFMLYNISAKTA